MGSTIPVIPYLAGGRELCVTGACLLTADAGLLGQSIRLFEGHGAWCSHAAAVVRFPSCLVAEERVTLIESLEHGPVPTYLSHYFQGFEGRLFLAIPKGLAPAIQEDFAAWCLDKVLKQIRYDYRGLAGQIFGHVREDGRELFCSELVGLGWEESGLTRLPWAPKGLLAQPPDLPNWWAMETVVELIGPFVQAEVAA
jgi:hypothetical protein